MKTKTLFFDIEGITCVSCIGRIEACLPKDRAVQGISISSVTKRARIQVEETATPDDIISLISSVDKKFKAKWLPPDDEKAYYFSIRGMTSSKDAQLIRDKLEQKKEDVTSFSVNYSTGIATLTTFSSRDKEKDELIGVKLKELIESSIEGRELQAKIFYPESNGHNNQDNTSQYRKRALLNALVGIPLLLLSGFIPLPLTIGGQLIGLFIGGITFGVMWQSGKEFYKGAWDKLINHRSSDMNTLIALGTGSAWMYSMMIVLVPGLFPLAALQYHFLAINMILGIVNLGRSLRASAEQQTKNKVQKLAQVYVNLQPQYAKVLNIPFTEDMCIKGMNDHYFEEISYKKIKEGDIIQVLKDKRVPVEGIIISEQETFVNEETLTGEPEGCNKKKGDPVFSGTLNQKNTIYIRATRNGKDGHLTRVIDDVNKSSASKPPSISKLVDRIAVVFVPMIVSVAGLSALGWYLLGPVPALPWMIKSVMSVLLCACPCALGLATPISTAIGMFKQLHKKILVHDASALEIASQITTVVFDKTGTLTYPALHHVYVPEDKYEWSSEIIIKYAASVEKSFDHPIAKSFMSENSSHETYLCENALKEDAGVSGDIGGQKVVVGSLQHMESNKIEVSEEFLLKESENERNGMSSVYVAIDGECISIVAFKHELRKDAKKTIADLDARGIDIFMLTGDQKEPAKAVAEQLGIRSAKVYAKHGSQAKRDFILELKARGRIVAMVGDGVNDIEAMEAADLGIAVGSWTHASSVAKVATQQLNFIPFLIMAKETMNNILQNLYWTGFYNLLSLTAATGLLYYTFGFALNPVAASLLMACSSISVVINSMRLAPKIDLAMAIYEGRVQPPKTTFEKVKQYIPFQGLIDALLTAFTASPPDDIKAPDKANQFGANPIKTNITPPSTPEKPKFGRGISSVINLEEAFATIKQEEQHTGSRLRHQQRTH